MPHLTCTGIRARVRNDGAIGPFVERVFDLMLDANDHPDKQIKEAKRIIRQIGYECRNVEFERPGN